MSSPSDDESDAGATGPPTPPAPAVSPTGTDARQPQRGDGGHAIPGHRLWPYAGSELTTRAWREEALVRAIEIETLSSWVSALPCEQRGVRMEEADGHLLQAIENHVNAVRSA